MTPRKTTLSLNTESTSDREGEQWSVPINLQVNQMMRFGSRIVQVGASVRYWADSPDGSADGWGLRINVILVYPRQSQ